METKIVTEKKVVNDSDRVLGVKEIIKTHTDKLNIMKVNLSLSEEEKWTDAEIHNCENMIKTLAAILSDLNRCLAS